MKVARVTGRAWRLAWVFRVLGMLDRTNDSRRVDERRLS